jgi:hypothetical protein
MQLAERPESHQKTELKALIHQVKNLETKTKLKRENESQTAQAMICQTLLIATMMTNHKR